MSESFPTDAAENRIVEPIMEAAGIEPARHSPGKYRPPYDTPLRLEYHHRLDAAYLAEMAFVRRVEDGIAARDDLAEGTPTLLYVIADGLDALKFGVARDPVARLAGLQIGNHRPLILLAATPGSVKLERLLHHIMAEDRLSGEWFAPTNRVLAIASLLVAAAEQSDDLERSGEYADAEFTVASMAWRSELAA